MIHHIFIFTDDDGKIADELINFGLSEGSNRVHAGQGTINRKFYFDNFYLEILWVYNEAEIKSEQIKPTGLWQRAEFRANNFSPFGLCLVNSDDTGNLFENSFKYQPYYFPKGNVIDIIKNDNQTDLPWTFRLPFKGQMKHENEQTNHRNGIAILTKAIFEYQKVVENKFLENFNNVDDIQFIQTSRNWLILVFDDGKQGKTKDFEKINLTIKY